MPDAIGPVGGAGVTPESSDAASIHAKAEELVIDTMLACSKKTTDQLVQECRKAAEQ